MMGSNVQDARSALAWLGLALTPGLSAARALELVRGFGAADAVLAASPGALSGAGLEPAVIEALRGAEARAHAELARLSAAGAELRTMADGAYPAALRAIADPPLALAVRGSLAPDELVVAIVGARRASEYGRRVAGELSVELARVGVTVASGLAAGIDAAAHRGALAAGGRTVAVLGTGIDGVYPRWHADLSRAIAEGGALVSEFPCGTPPRAAHFPQRNRIISGLARGVVVVEAAARSGSLITARYALEQGREVFAVPGPVGVSRHEGPHELIRQGAKLVTRIEDVLEELAPALVERIGRARAAAEEASLSALERRVLAAVSTGGGHVDDVIRRAGLSAGSALETLLALELRGVVEQAPGKRFRRRAA
jgi:DNA processing protein